MFFAQKNPRSDKLLGDQTKQQWKTIYYFLLLDINLHILIKCS
jgi:hypothetical protein